MANHTFDNVRQPKELCVYLEDEQNRNDLLASLKQFRQSMRVSEADSSIDAEGKAIAEELEREIADLRWLPWIKAKLEIRKSIWHTFCNIKVEGDKKTGIPADWAKEIFDKDGIGDEILEAALAASLAALGNVWAAAAAILTAETGLGKKVKDWLYKIILGQLDQWEEKKLGQYCAVLPKE